MYTYVRKDAGHPHCIYDIMDRQAVREQVQAHLDGKENKRLFIWSLLYTEEWLKAYG